jgi:hypothetical protein
MGITNLALAKFDATTAELLAIEQEIHPVREEKERFIKMLLNGIGSRVDQQTKVEKAKAKAKAKGRKVATATGRAEPCATIGARGMGTVVTLPPATSLTMVLKVGPKGKGKEQHRYRRKPLRKRRKKSWQW